MTPHDISSNLGNRILIPLDGSDPSYRAVRYVCRMIRPEMARITLLHIFQGLPEPVWDMDANPYARRARWQADAWRTARRQSIEEFMERACKSLTSAGIPANAISTEIRDMKQGVARDIAAEAGRGYNAVILSRRGAGVLRGLILGSTANKLMGRLPNIPLCLVGSKPANLKTLLAVDGSPGSQKAAALFGRLHRPEGHRVTLLHAVRETSLPKSMRPTKHVLSESIDAWIDDHLRNIHLQMVNIRTNLENQGFNKDLIHIETATRVKSRAGAIVETARSEEYGTIVVGRRGISQITDHTLGRVSDRVMQLGKSYTVWIVS
jgi:nucleotide-binding universal stress UspA family protein